MASITANMSELSPIQGALLDLTNSLPDNPFQPPMKYAWSYMEHNYSRFQIACVGSVILHEVFFVLLNLPYFLAQFFPRLQKYKVQKDKPQTSSEQVKALRYILFSHVFVHVPFVCGTYLFTEFFAISFAWETMPTWYSLLGYIYLCMIIEDTWHYFMHRLLHSKALYKHCHKIHHSFQAPFSITAEYAHPVETFVLGFGMLWGYLLFGHHLILLWSWAIVRMIESYDVHSGYEFPFNPMHLIPFYGGTRFHDFHHKNFVGNYSSTFTWWDKIFGTDVPYKDYVRRQEAAKNKDQ